MERSVDERLASIETQIGTLVEQQRMLLRWALAAGSTGGIGAVVASVAVITVSM